MLTLHMTQFVETPRAFKNSSVMPQKYEFFS